MEVISTDDEEQEENKQHDNYDYHSKFNYNYNNSTTEIKYSTMQRRQEPSANIDIGLVDKNNSDSYTDSSR